MKPYIYNEFRLPVLYRSSSALLPTFPRPRPTHPVVLRMDVTTENEPLESITNRSMDPAAVVAGTTGPSPEEAASLKQDEAAADHVAIPTPALGGGASVSQEGAEGGMQGSRTSCAEKSTGATETDPGTLNRPSSAGKLSSRRCNMVRFFGIWKRLSSSCLK